MNEATHKAFDALDEIEWRLWNLGQYDRVSGSACEELSNRLQKATRTLFIEMHRITALPYEGQSETEAQVEAVERAGALRAGPPGEPAKGENRV